MGNPARQSFSRTALKRREARRPASGCRLTSDSLRRWPQQAAQQASDEAGVAAEEITHLVTVSCSGFSAPGIDVRLICDLGLPPETSRTHIGFMGCHGAEWPACRGAFADTSTNATVLVCAIELCTLHHQFGWQSDQLVANSLFARRRRRSCHAASRRDPHDDWPMVDQLSALIPDSSDLIELADTRSRLSDDSFAAASRIAGSRKSKLQTCALVGPS